MKAYKLDDLAREAQVAPRTVRYYVQRGLLPAPEFRGKDTTYGPGHLLRLAAIRRLQEAHLPLEEIQARLAGASDAELERIAGSSVVVEIAPPAHPYRSPSPRAPSAPPAGEGERWARHTLADGVELHVRTDLSREAARLVESILNRK